VTEFSNKSIFFDLDGTLTDPKEGITGCIQYALERLGEPVPEADDLTWCIGPPLLGNFEQLIGKARAAEGVRFYRERFSDVGLFENKPYAGIHDTLQTLLERGYDLNVASSKPEVFVKRILERYNLTSYFRHVFGAELDGTRSDKSELLGHALVTAGIHPCVTTMVGDRKFDAIGAASNGIDFVGVLYGYGDEAELTAAGAKNLVHRHEELLEVFP